MTTYSTEFISKIVTVTGQYRSHLKFNDGQSTAVDNTRAFEFFTLMSRMRNQTNTTEFYTAYPQLRAYVSLDKEMRANDVLMQKKCNRWVGLIRHLQTVVGFPSLDDVSTTERSENGANPNKKSKSTWRYAIEPNRTKYESATKSHSTKETGIAIDDQLRDIFLLKPVPKESIHPYTLWLIYYFYQRAWLPCGFQLPIWSKDIKEAAGSHDAVCSPVDIIVFDLAQRCFVMLELKTGYDNNYNTKILKEGKEFFWMQDKPDTFFWRHQHQLGWMYENLHKNLDHITPGKPTNAYILRVSDVNGVRSPMSLSHHIRAFYTDIYNGQLQSKLLVDENSNLPNFDNAKARSKTGSMLATVTLSNASDDASSKKDNENDNNTMQLDDNVK